MTNISPDSATDMLGEPKTRKIHYHTSSSSENEESDVVVVQPSFDDHGVVDGPVSPASLERQSRSPDCDKKDEEGEERNPSSPAPGGSKKGRRPNHARNISSMLGATKISDDIVVPDQDGRRETDYSSRKHRRMFSGGVSNPNLAHRRLDSGGQIAPVPRRRHHRENSEGLDMLSFAANASRDETVTVPAVDANSRPDAWESHPRPPSGHVSATSSYSHGPPHAYGPHNIPPSQHHQMEPPPPQRFRAPYPPHHPTPYVHHYPPPPTNGGNGFHHYNPPLPHGSSYYAYGSSGPVHPYPAHYPQRQSDYYKGSDHRVHHPQDLEHDEFDRNMPTRPSDWEHQHRPSASSENVGGSSNHQGVQTFVTAISVGGQDRTVMPTRNHKNAATNTEAPHANVPPDASHHRSMPSYSNVGTPFSTPSVSGLSDPYAKAGKGHHRATSSSVSFLNGLDGLDDANFLRTLQASNEPATFRHSPPPALPHSPPPAQSLQSHTNEFLSQSPDPEELDQTDMDSDEAGESQGGVLKLAAGGTSKRVRRKCTIAGCNNRVVQGGLCISHGAKRKTCKYPGCNKNVKKAGLCSTHGPARKRCEYPDCPKVAVQGGRCIAHGAKKKLCSVEDCTKQAILSGMCKKHHDQEHARKHGVETCQPVTIATEKPVSHKPTHTRGLSIFQEMSADVVSSILNDAGTSAKPPSVVANLP